MASFVFNQCHSGSTILPNRRKANRYSKAGSELRGTSRNKYRNADG